MSEPLTEEQLEEVARTINRVLKEASDGCDIGTAVRVELTQSPIGRNVPVWYDVGGGKNHTSNYDFATRPGNHATNVRVLIPEDKVREWANSIEQRQYEGGAPEIGQYFNDRITDYRRGAG